MGSRCHVVARVWRWACWSRLVRGAAGVCCQVRRVRSRHHVSHVCRWGMRVSGVLLSFSASLKRSTRVPWRACWRVSRWVWRVSRMVGSWLAAMAQPRRPSARWAMSWAWLGVSCWVWVRWVWICPAGTGRNAKVRQRDVIVGKSVSASVAVRMRITREGGSSNVFKKAFAAPIVAELNSVTIATL